MEMVGGRLHLLNQTGGTQPRAYRNAIHIDSRIPGYPTSNGCIHLGSGSATMYKRFCEVTLGSRKQLTTTMRMLIY